MNKDEMREAGRVMIAYADGAEVQNTLRPSISQSLPINRETIWRDYVNQAEPQWNWKNYSYRVKPRPMECWVRVSNSAEDDDKFGTAWDTKERAEAGEFKPFRVVKFTEAPDE